MNVQFTDKLSATCWHHTSMADKTKYLDNWLLRFFHGGWADRDDDHPEDVPVRDLWKRQRGAMGVLVLSVDVSSINRSTGDLIANEFDWAVFAVPVDTYGLMQGDPNANNRLIVGGLVNHGSDEDPSWSSHT
jgi:hypothetical protein